MVCTYTYTLTTISSLITRIASCIHMYKLSLPIRIKRGFPLILFHDNGTHQIEVVMLRFALKYLHPGQVLLVRGSFEFRAKY